MKISSDDCKTHLVSHSMAQGQETKASQWKRGRKSKDGDDVVREFLHPTLGGYAVIERAGKLLAPTAIGSDRTSELAAKALVARMLSSEDGGYGMIGDAIDQGIHDPKAIAGQFVFGIAGPTYYAQGGLIAIVTPKSYWESKGFWYDQEVDLDRLMPEGSEDLNGCGTWLIPYPSMDALAFRDELRSRGFVWTQDFQKSVNESGCDDAEEFDPSVLDNAGAGGPRP